MWIQKDEWINAADGTHTVIYHNPQVQVVKDIRTGEKGPAEYHLVHKFKKVEPCAHCGQLQHRHRGDEEPVDFHAIKSATLAMLQADHSHTSGYSAEHPTVRHDHGPKDMKR